MAILRNALRQSSHPGIAHDQLLSDECNSDDIALPFLSGVEQAINHMFQKQQRSMELGLKDLTDFIAIVGFYNHNGLVREKA